MGRRRWIMLAVTALMVGAVAVPAGAGVPVSSFDNTGDSLANRTEAVTNIVVAMNARLDRIHPPDAPPSPCLELGDGCGAVLFAQVNLLSSIRDVCVGEPPNDDGVAGLTIADSDAFADNFTASGLENQLFSVATVLGSANSRFLGIWVPPNPIYPNPGPPGGLELVAVNMLYDTVVLGLPPGTEFPPSPCTVIGVGS